MKLSYVRKLTKTLALLTLLAPESTYPLGIGSINLQSALNQNLNAEIPLLLSPGEKAVDIKVNLASPDKFEEAGIPWNYFLSKISFETVERPNGLVVIKLSSKEALKEPFLGLLLQVSWPKGSLYREFSLLVDPEEVYNQATVPVVALPKTSSPISGYTPPERLPENNWGRFSFAPPVGSYQPQLENPKPSEKSSNTYGLTKKNDTLWKISERAGRQRNVSLVQMMISIFKRNPDAFFSENINALRTGKMLQIPKREAVLKLSRQQALAEYERQNTAWKNRKTAGAVEKTPIPATSPKEDQPVENQLVLAAPSEELVAENAVVTPGQEQAKSTVNSKNDGVVSKGETRSDAAEKTAAYDDLETKIIALQQQLSKMQEILAIKDQQLAALQQQINAKPAATAQPPAAQTKGITEKPLPLAEARNFSQPTKTKPVSEQESDSSYLSAVAAIVLIILSVLGWVWWRKRHIASTLDDTESNFAPTENYQPAEQPLAYVPHVNAPLDENNVFQVGPMGEESSFLSEFTPGDFEAFDNDEAEIDPISEADVYLAYGRYQQAEDLVRQAITDYPDRDGCKLKLLEIFNTVENKTAFVTYAEELASSGKKSDKSFWEKVTEMGNEICPDSPLFSSMENASVFTAPVAENTSLDLTKNKSKFEKLKTSDSADSDEDSFDDFLLKNGSSNGSSEKTISETNLELGEEPHNNQDIDFDLNAFSPDTDDLNDLGISSQETLSEPNKNDIDYDLESFDFDLIPENSLQPKLDDIDLFDSKKEEEFDLDEGLDLDTHFNFDFDTSEIEEPESDPENISGVSDLTDMDELETKLDLARAYLDMGDEDSAKDITEEVLERGSEEQKKVAQKLINSIR